MNDRILYTVREPKRLTKKTSRKSFWILGTFILITSLGVALVYALRLPFWKIQKIELSGLETLGQEEIKIQINESFKGQYAFFLPRNSFFLFSPTSLADVLKSEFPRIKTATVEKKFPDLLKISIKERQLFGVFCNTITTSTSTSPCAYIDKTGFAYETAPNSSGSLFIKIKSDAPEARAGAKIDPQLMNEILYLGGKLKKGADLETIDYEFYSKNPRELKVKTSDGFKIIFMRDSDWEKTIHALKTVLNQEIKEKRQRLDYIDLRFGNKVFYKLR